MGSRAGPRFAHGRFDPEYDAHEKEYEQVKRELLGIESEDEEAGEGQGESSEPVGTGRLQFVARASGYICLRTGWTSALSERALQMARRRRRTARARRTRRMEA